VVGIVQVETSPAYAGDVVAIESPQFVGSCNPPPGPSTEVGFVGINAGPSQVLKVPLDNEGNATVVILGQDCAPGTDLVDASLTVAPFLTATTELTVEPPAVTTPGLSGFPTRSGTVTGGEVETGDSGTFASSIIAVFYVETDPVYAEQPVDVTSPELEARCGQLSEFQFLPLGNTPVIDNDGNAAFLFFGASCAAGSSVVTADVLAGTHPTYTTTFNILPPQPTI
jgi:hypothetical protein